MEMEKTYRKWTDQGILFLFQQISLTAFFVVAMAQLSDKYMSNSFLGFLTVIIIIFSGFSLLFCWIALFENDSFSEKIRVKLKGRRI